MSRFTQTQLLSVWKYLKSLESDDYGRIEFNFEDHYIKLQLSEVDLSQILVIFEKKGLIIREGYMEGAFITLL